MNPIVKALRKYEPIWREAKDNSINEADVVTRVIRFLEDGLGYDTFKHITKEFQIKERFVDVAVKINDKVCFYVEVKAPSVVLKESQIFQAESYASQSGVNWVVLTNGVEWQLYHLIFDKTGIEHNLIFSLNMLDIASYNQTADKLYYLSYESIKGNDLNKYWDRCLALRPDSIIRALFHEDTLSSLRREIRRKTDMLIDEDELVDSLKRLLSPDVIAQYSDNIKISRKRKSSKVATEVPTTASPAVTQTAPQSVPSGEQPVVTEQIAPVNDSPTNTVN